MISPAELRARMIEIARRRQRPGTGSSIEFLRRRTAMREWPDLTDVLGGIRWATIGGVAVRHYAPERATVDLDVLIAGRTSAAAREQLRAGGYRFRQELAVPGSSWAAPDGTTVEVLESDDPWVNAALEQARNNCDLQGLPTLPFPYLILLKLRAGRFLDLGDIGRLLALASEDDRDAVREVVRRYEPAAAEDIDAMIELARLELG